MGNLNIEIPSLTDEAAANLEEFFLALINAFSEQYYYQIQRHYKDSRPENGITNDELFIREDDPPF